MATSGPSRLRQLRDLAALMRPANAAMTMVAVLIGAAVPRAPQGYEEFLAKEIGLAMLAAFLITSFGNVVNDVSDAAIDRKAHPSRPLAAGRLKARTGQLLASALVAAGCVAAWFAGGWFLTIFAAVNAFGLGIYSRWLKPIPAIGNVTVALLVASAFFFGASTTGSWGGSLSGGWLPRHWGSLWGLAAMAFLATLAREWAKDLQDAPHDEGRQTLARLAPRLTMRLAIAATGLACILAMWMVLPVVQPWWLDDPLVWDGVGWHGFGFGPTLHDKHLGLWRVGVAASLPIFGAAAARIPASPRVAQRLLKIAMAVALVGYSWAALLAFEGN